MDEFPILTVKVYDRPSADSFQFFAVVFDGKHTEEGRGASMKFAIEDALRHLEALYA